MQLQCNFNIMSFGSFFCFPCFLESKATAFKMSADIYNCLVFCVSTESVGPQQIKCH